MSSSAPFEFSSLTYTLDDVIAETEDTAANTDDPALRTAALDLDKLVESPELPSIFALACLFNVPLCTLSDSGNEEDKSGVHYGLGAGASCSVVSFRTGEDERKACSPGTMVALKRYHPPTPGLRDRESSMARIHKLLGQELRAHCFPALREHENICKLLFLGWEDTSLLPAAALELATFGTLDDALQDMRSYSSALTKAHITFDIVAGLNAIHQCGLVHGDVKPGNIIICEHPSRLVIAKISDLNGVAPSESYGKKQSFFWSPLWQAPEALQRENNIDWQLCDVYSLAMVLTTIWTTKGWIPPGGCFLDPLLEYDYKDDAYMQRIEAAKLLPDRFDGSMVKTACQSLEGANIPPNLPMKDIISLGLSAIASRRPPLTEIMSRYLSKFAQECGRTMQLASSDRSTDTHMFWQFDQPSQSVSVAVALHPLFLERSPSFKTAMFQAFSQSPYLSKDGLIQLDFSHDSLLGFHGTDEKLLDILMSWRKSTVCRIKESGDVQHFIINAYNLAIFHLLGIGTPVDESEALKWMSRAALLGEGVSTLLFPSIEQSAENLVKQDLALPRRLWCAAVIQSWGPREATQCLRPIDPYLLQASLAVRRRRLGGWSYNRQFRLTDEYLSPLFDLVGKDPARAMNTAPVLNQLDDVGETILHVCAAMADLQLFRRSLQEESVDINVTNNRGETPLFYAVRAGKLDVARLLLDNGASVNNINTDGWSLLHCLTMMEDKEAAELAPLLIARYAPMNIEVNETRRGPRCDSFHLGAGIPLFWAALKSCPCLFEVLLLAHRRPGYRIRYGDRYQLLQFLATLNQADMLRLVLEAGDSIVEPDESPIDESARETIRARCRQLVFSISGVPVSRLQPGSVALDVEDFSYLLRHALDTKPMHVLQRRVVHGSGFRRAKKLTLKHLLGAGADPINTRGYDMPRQPRMPELMVAIRHSDTIALEIFLEYAEASGMDVCQLLTRPFRCWVGDLDFDMDAVAVTIRGDARETFAMLLDRYPSVLEKPKRRGVEALRLAAMEDWPGYVETLINLGVADDEDPLVPLFLALSRNNNLDVIKILSEKPGTGMMLKRDPDKRHRAFKVVLHSVLDHKSNIGIDRLRFLVDEYGVPNFTQEDTSLAEIITSDTPATDTARQAFEDAVLRYLLELLPQNINSLDSCGFSPLHRATFYGKSSQVEILLDHGADVHLKTSQEVPGGFAGCRPIDIVRLHRVSEIPEDIAARGSREIQTWQKNLKTILTLLHDREPPSPMEPGFKIDPETGFPFCEELGPLAGIMTDSVQRHDRRQDGKWPQRMPWESGSPNPFEGPDFNQILSDGYTSYIGSDGLTIFPKARELFGLQMRNGVFNPELMAGTAVEDKPQPPGGMNAALEDYTLRARDLFQINQRLPEGWDIGETEDERLYYIDHSNRRTTWDPPRESAQRTKR